MRQGKGLFRNTVCRQRIDVDTGPYKVSAEQTVVPVSSYVSPCAQTAGHVQSKLWTKYYKSPKYQDKVEIRLGYSDWALRKAPTVTLRELEMGDPNPQCPFAPQDWGWVQLC